MQFTWQLGVQLRVLEQIEALLDQPGPDRTGSQSGSDTQRGSIPSAPWRRT